MTTRPGKSWATRLLVTAVALSAAACTSSVPADTPADIPAGAPLGAQAKAAQTRAESSPEAGASPKVSPSPPPRFKGVGHRLPTGKDLRNDPALYESVTLTGCHGNDGMGIARGTVQNTQGHHLRYSILVLFTDAHARTIDSARTRLDLRAGRTSTWHATRHLDAPAGLRCVVRAVTGGARTGG